MVKEVEVKVFEEYLYCDKCGAEMKHQGIVLCTYPPQYPYICSSCDWCTTSTRYFVGNNCDCAANISRKLLMQLNL